MAKKLLFTTLVLISTAANLFAQLPKVACGTVERLEKFQSKFVDPRNVDIWLPAGYSGDKKYAVLYMHDGQALYDSTLMWNKQEWGVDETMCKLLAEHKIKDCIVVGIWNNGVKRFPEYFPQKAFYSMAQQQQEKILAIGRDKGTPLLGDGPVSDNYLKFLVTELKPYIDSHYSTIPDQQHTFTVGSSMGGLISMYAICEYPDVFSGAACLSTHWPGTFTTEDNPIPAAFLEYLKTHLPSPANHKLYFDYGSATLDAMYKPYQQQADNIMKEAGYTENDWITREYPGADHSENSWRKRLSVPLLFLLGK
ncbi:alpha/beta hydrolase [Mucilaginibacter ginsenosidivorans]|uniref:Alpha/beta hydrolase n=1 Tax=Mucilaginibacter ginsenosidivorans TaxID=398053 RepID=A0A5B8UWJ5_9SPHI|nr:alpha/beta hydrolase-fold protein [Mucilaginibacter ginsenosidivorans]QEC63517.1 alpha/beta hydrolase [Mucilaginibacter ginsenosidivorans]